ncbi:NucA/NucB deoxyribonuclease domain-containing protein [Streptomyces sp. 4F14]|uniref:NucA/NucB deoxyribonuclease domain-containing protein n=1 Tax=Streptomyces sp. 4F14 TaxID=3394380 RepID=UPI003A881309
MTWRWRTGVLAALVALAAGSLAPVNAVAAAGDGEGRLVSVVRTATGERAFEADGSVAKELRADPADRERRIRAAELEGSAPAGRRAGVTDADQAHALALRSGAEYGTASEELASGKANTLQQDDITLEECRANTDLSWRAEGWIKNHFSYCQIAVLVADQFRCWSVFCVPIGGFSGRITHMGYAYDGLRDVDWKVYVDEISSWGTSDAGTLKIDADCAGSTSDACVSGGFDQVTKAVPQWEADPEGSLLFHSWADPPDASRGEQVKRGTFSFSYDFRADGGNKSADGPVTGVRFDSAWYLPKKEGSIFDRVTPWLSYSTKDGEVNESAWHIRDAQDHPESTYPRVDGKRIPGASAADPLRRLYHDTTRRTQNRERFAVPVCEQQWPGYPELSQDCDEYPFSATYEGAARHLYETNVPYGRFSVRPVLFSDNQEAGSRLGTWYGRDRILDGDRFYVRIVD